ncbi:HlyD family efflux transporter periplasmic adaptor subunit [Thermoanaerobacter sp. A7A]|uniref:HlyD family efflux transporter periplasmic adaptor subunit n=1 Tax=Thermoanaerobacter sp. A7A TaxID=1350366 RepID=UPI00041B0EA7|nr:HlyD family efflux transporter periplasmic adaptor subunit [Thermoanaerobacter sp. A7A]
MREIVQNIEELTDSRELLESKPHPIASVSVYILLLLITSFLIWSYFSEKEIVVKANGIIRPYKDEFIISNKVTGNVERIYVTDGQKVKKGDALYVIEHKNLELQKSILEKQLANKISEVENLKKLKNSIQDGKNYFDKSSENEMYYYYKYLDFYINKKAIESQLYGINVQAQNIDNILENLKNLKKSIDQNENKINNDTSYYNQFVDYQMNINQRQDKIEQLQRELLRQIEEAQEAIYNAREELANYKNGYMLNIKNNIEQNYQQLNQLKSQYSQIQDIQDAINNLRLLQRSIYDNKSYFSTYNSYYYKFLDYQMNVQQYQNKIAQLQKTYDSILQNPDALPSQIEDALVALNNAKQEFEIYKNQYLMSVTASIEENETKLHQLQNLSQQMQTIQNNIDNLKLLQKSINDNHNYFSSDSSYYNQFIDYQMNIKQREDKIQQLQNALTQKYYDAEKTVQNAKDDLINYQNQYMLSLKANIEQNEAKLKEIKANLNNVNVEKFTADTIAQIEDNIYSDEKEIEKLKAELQNINLAIEDYIIKSPVDGKIDMMMSIKEGDLVQSGLEIIKIIPDNPQYRVKLYIPNKDIADIKVGQKIKYHILALPYQEYGELSGEIVKLSIDSRLDKQSGLNYYEAEATIDNKPLYNRKGEKKNIKVGMIVEAHVIGHREKMLYYLLEQLNLKD